jgi:DNA invertase Pin-like site-specific DNA recombinase
MQPTQNTLSILGYTRVSTAEQEESGAGLKAQAQHVRDAAAYRRWNVLEIVQDTGSGKDLDRETLYAALSRLAGGEADALVVAKLDRLTRSLVDFARLLQWFEDAGKALIALDFDLDTSTPTGELVAHIIMAVAQWERRAIGQRTADALATLRADGKPTNGGNVGDDSELAQLIRGLRFDDGLTLDAIAARLNADGVPTMRGGKHWRKSALVSILGYERRPRRRKLAALPEI